MSSSGDLIVVPLACIAAFVRSSCIRQSVKRKSEYVRKSYFPWKSLSLSDFAAQVRIFHTLSEIGINLLKLVQETLAVKEKRSEKTLLPRI